VYVLDPKLMQWNFIKICYQYKVVRTNLFADFWSFRNFRPQFRELITIEIVTNYTRGAQNFVLHPADMHYPMGQCLVF